tara:strand:- start:125 stop:367 length:243 start_codon:yes stop_codon:yes gene_type:complete
MTQERKMPDKEKEQQLSDGELKRRQFLKTVVIGSSAVAVGTALPTYSGKQELRSSDPELERIQAVLNKCGSEFGNIRKGY